MAIYLSYYILMNVLSRLPVKSIVRFRSVSKSWFSLISCPDFAKLQFELASSHKMGFYRIMELCYKNKLQLWSFDGQSGSQRFELPFFIASSRATILGSAKGLLCVCSSEYDSFYIFNPCTNQYRDIPALIYHQHSQVHYYGFGYDSTTNDYKLLVVTLLQRHWENRENSGDAMISIFSLRRGTWRSSLDANHFHKYICVDCPGICLNDAIHWSLIENTDPLTRPVIVSFGLAEERFSISHVPDLCERRVRLSVLDGCLCLSSSRLSRDNLYALTIWMMKEHGVSSSWTELITLEFADYAYSFIYPLCLTGEGEILYRYGMSGLVSFDAQTKTFKNHPGCYGFNGFNQMVHVETLISPRCNTAAT